MTRSPLPFPSPTDDFIGTWIPQDDLVERTPEPPIQEPLAPQTSPFVEPIAPAEPASVVVMGSTSKESWGDRLHSLLSPLYWLVRLLGLDIHGSRGLTRPARLEIQFMALGLCLMGLIEVVGLSLYFNLYAAGGVVIGPYSMVALLLGMGTAFFPVLFERQWLASSASLHSIRSVVAMIGRFAAILFSIHLTSIPLNIIFFGQEIAKRTWEERILQEIVVRLEEIHEADKAMAGRTWTEIEKDVGESGLPALVETRSQELREADGALTSLQGRISYARARQAEARRLANQATEEKTRNSYQSEASSWGTQAASLSAGLTAAHDQVTRATEAKADAERQMAGLRTDLGDKNEKTKAEGKIAHDRIQAWIARIRKAEPGSLVHENDNGTGWWLAMPTTSFNEKDRVLDDLMDGVGPRLPESELTKGDWDFITGTLRFERPGQESADTLQRRLSDADRFQSRHLLILAGCAMVPLLLLASKFLLREETKGYFQQVQDLRGRLITKLPSAPPLGWTR